MKLTTNIILASFVCFFLKINYVFSANINPINNGNNDVIWKQYHLGNFVKACEAWRGLARYNNIIAQFNYGFCLEEGLASEKRPAEASLWYGSAAEAGLPQAQHNLALLRLNGTGIRKDIILAYFWLNISSEKLESSRIALKRIRQSHRLNRDQIRKINQLLRAHFEKNKKLN